MSFFLARVGRVIGADAVDHALCDAVPETVAVAGVADGRIELGVRAKPLVTFRSGQREMSRRRFRRCNVFVVTQE